MSTLRKTTSGVVAAALFAAGGIAVAAQNDWTKADYALTEEYVREEMPPGFQVVVAELEGAVFADANGKTLYSWPVMALRNANAGEMKGKPTCSDVVQKVNTGWMSPYPGGLELPEVATRPSCVGAWPPVLAPEGAKPVGKWTIEEGPGGRRQWAYDGQALYTSVLDKQKGDVWGGTSTNLRHDGTGAVRWPVGPARNLPSQFKVMPYSTGRLLTLANEHSVYVFDGDKNGKLACTGACLEKFAPVLAPEQIRPRGEWTTIERSPGVKQWAYRGRPVYSYNLEEKFPSFQGSDEAGWHNVFTQLAPPFPKGFQITKTFSGEMLADAKGRTIYTYNCNDDAADQLDCSHPSQPQAYRLALCGKGDWKRCLETFPYLTAGENEKSETHFWAVKYINPETGRWVEPGAAGALRIWSYRDRPVYLCGRDRNPGDYECDSWGEWSGIRNGYMAFWIRDAFGDNAI